MILADRNEADNHPELIGWLRQSCEVQTGNYNQTSGNPIVYPDFQLTDPRMHEPIGVNRKTVNEVLSSPEKVLEQIQRELAGPVEQLVLLIEGIAVPDGNSGGWAYDLDWSSIHLYTNTDQRGTVGFKRQHSRTNWTHVQNTMTRLEWLGVQVVHSYSLYDTSTKLIALHDLALSGEPNRVLDKLIKGDLKILALDPGERAMALSLMGLVGGNVGEELGLTLASTFSSIVELIEFWSSGGTFADQMMRSGTRRIGNAAERKLQAALGWTTPSGSVLQPSEPTSQQDTALSHLS